MVLTFSSFSQDMTNLKPEIAIDIFGHPKKVDHSDRDYGALRSLKILIYSFAVFRKCFEIHVR